MPHSRRKFSGCYVFKVDIINKYHKLNNQYHSVVKILIRYEQLKQPVNAMKKYQTPLPILGMAICALIASNLQGQTTTNLDFSHNVQANDGNNPNGAALGPYYSGAVLDYTNVGSLNGVGIDARMTATAFGQGYSFVGHIYL